MSETSIINIRKKRFLKDFLYEDFKNLYRASRDHREYFDQNFFTEATNKAIIENNVEALLFISQLYLKMDMLIEAEYVIGKAYLIDKNNIRTIYQLVELFCRRYRFFHAKHYIDLLEKKENGILYTKSLIKFYLIGGTENELKELILDSFDSYKKDVEYIFLVYDSAISIKLPYLMKLAFTSIFSKKLYNSLNERGKKISKKYMIEILINILNMVKYEL